MIFEELYSKRYVFVPLRSNNLKMVLALLIEVIVFYVQVTIVKIGVPGFKKFIKIVSSFERYNWSCWGLVLDLFDINLNELLEKVIAW